MTSENIDIIEMSLPSEPPSPTNACILRGDTVWYSIATSVDGDEAVRLDEAGRSFLEHQNAKNVMIDLSHAKQFSISAQNT